MSEVLKMAGVAFLVLGAIAFVRAAYCEERDRDTELEDSSRVNEVVALTLTAGALMALAGLSFALAYLL